MELERIKRRSCHQTSDLLSSSEGDQHLLSRDAAAGAGPSGQAQHGASGLQLTPSGGSSAAADLGMCHEKGVCWLAQEESKEGAAVSGGACGDPHLKCGGCDGCRQSLLDEDSRLEYLSAHEPDVEDGSSLSEFSGQVEALELMDPAHEAARSELAKEPHLDVSEGGSVAAECDQSCPAAELQDSVSLPDCTGELEAGEESSPANTCCLSSEEDLKSSSRIHQAVDASSDFRACFTTSRSTSAQLCLFSRAVNTEITLMDNPPPPGWCWVTPAGAGGTGKTESQLPLHRHRGDNISTAEKSENQEQQEFQAELGSRVLKTERLSHLGSPAVRSCCQESLQRAMEAELQVLNAHYQLCYQHCLKVCTPALEDTIRCHGKTRQVSSLLLVLEELKRKYKSMRVKIQTGVPLSALPPLSVEVNVFPASFPYVPCQLFQEDLCSDSVSAPRGAAFEAPGLEGGNISVHRDFLVTHLMDAGKSFQGGLQAGGETGAGQPSDSASSRAFGEHQEDVGIGVFAPQSWVKNEEGKEFWFDAEEDLAGEAFSVPPGTTKKPHGKEGDRRDTDEANLAVEGRKQERRGRAASVELDKVPSAQKGFPSQVLRKKLGKGIPPAGNSERNEEDQTFPSAFKPGRAAEATSAPRKTLLLPKPSSGPSSSAQVPSETKRPGQQAEGFLFQADVQQQSSAPCSSHDAFIPPNMLNLSNFTKLMKKLQQLHPEANREKIMAALLEVRKDNHGILSGLSISSIMEKTSAVLRKPNPSCAEGGKAG
ncbi:RNA-binding protein 44 isoform X2 [Apus apus]|uniref:RNA-binding protein 44 isoform X2 n=1 Tax=Apus apus TaxID=8895 RepID=UPI0021F8A3EF|nr:RNA-binding protein 44 isoform X2 [Apus apus]